jgi:membrane protein
MTAILLGESGAEQAVDALFQLAPNHIALTLEPVVFDVLSQRDGSILTISGLAALWAATNGFEALSQAFDLAYNVEHRRNFILRRLQAVLLLILGALVAVLLGITIVLGPSLVLLTETFLGIDVPFAVEILRYVFGIGTFVLFLLVLHRILPSVRLPMRRLVPGVLFSTFIWVIGATAFSIYISNSPSYSVTYGALAGVVITLLFFYLTAATVILGAQLNAVLIGRL